MANTTVLRVVGQTTAISVTASSTSATIINDQVNDQVNFASFLNTGAVAVAVKLGDANVGAAVLPVSGTPGDFLLPPLMTTPVVLACPTIPFYVRMIGAGAGPSLVYVTPVADQS